MVSEDKLNGPTLARTIVHLSAHRGELRSMGEAIQTVSRPGAAREIVDHCYALVHKSLQAEG
jgi:hypothetical protein